MAFNFKDLGIGAGVGAGLTALALNTPKIAKATKDKLKSVKLNRSLKRQKKDQNEKPDNSAEETKE